MLFSSVFYPHRPARISFKATVVDVKKFDCLVCAVRPETTEISRFETLESILSDESERRSGWWEQVGRDSTVYEYKPCMDQNFNLNLKLRSNDDGLKFETTIGTSEDDISDRLIKGKKVEVVVSPGFYFNFEKKTYGMYYTVKSLELIAEKKRK